MHLLRIFIVADDPLARVGLATALGAIETCQVIGQSGSQEAVEDPLVVETADVIIWDLGWEADDALPAWEETAVPILALLPDGADAGAVWAGGAQGALLRHGPPQQLVAAAQAIQQGLAVFDPHLAQFPLPLPAMPDRSPAEALTPREQEVLQLLAEGLTNKAIAQRLHISDHTVKFHVNAILHKFNAQSRTEAVVRATRQGLLLL